MITSGDDCGCLLEGTTHPKCVNHFYEFTKFVTQYKCQKCWHFENVKMMTECPHFMVKFDAFNVKNVCYNREWEELTEEDLLVLDFKTSFRDEHHVR